VSIPLEHIPKKYWKQWLVHYFLLFYAIVELGQESGAFSAPCFVIDSLRSSITGAIGALCYAMLCY
jgi:hypothetical protein